MSARIVTMLTVALMAGMPFGADAEHHRAVATPDLPAWRQECGSCHLAFPPGLLPAHDWKSVMRSLDRHYGTDASLDADVAAAILAFLERNAGPARRGASAEPLRITTARWFTREHREIPQATWSRPAIGSPANCGACHRGADRGDFDEHAVRVPR